jgi:hypothetical protein
MRYKIPALATAVALLTGAGCTPPIVRLENNQPHRVARISLPATNVSRLTIDGKVGDIVIDSTLSDSLVVIAELRSHDADRLAEVCAPTSRLLREGGRELKLAIDQPTRNRCGERWIVQLPRTVAVHVNGTVANVTLAAATPELKVRLHGPGAIRGRVNSPVIDVEIDIGSIDLVSARGDVRHATAVSRIGSVEMSVRGLDFPSKRQPPGAVAEVTGRGDATFAAKSGNGKVKVIIE